MANDKEKEQPEPKPAAKSDLVTEIGTLTYPRAVQNFGKEKALEVMHKVAAIGGHGLFEDAHFQSPMFGGLAMPHPDLVAKPVRSDFNKFGEDAEFYFNEAMEEYQVNRERSAADRVKINELYLSLK